MKSDLFGGVFTRKLHYTFHNFQKKFLFLMDYNNPNLDYCSIANKQKNQKQYYF